MFSKYLENTSRTDFFSLTSTDAVSYIRCVSNIQVTKEKRNIMGTDNFLN